MMNIRTTLGTIALGLGSLAGAPALHADGRFSVTTGFDYTSGKYGAGESTEVVYVPLTFKYEGESTVYRLTVPYVRVTAPAGTVIGPDGRPLESGEGERTAESGMGDVVAGVSYNLVDTGKSGTLLDVTGKVKFGTADEDKGLGTGENDYSLQLDLFQTFGRVTAMATAGYRVYGDPPGVDFDNAWFGSLGAALRLGETRSAGFAYDTRQAILPGGDPQRELMLYLSGRPTRDTRLQGYVLTGMSDASPDWGVGAMVTVGF